MRNTVSKTDKTKHLKSWKPGQSGNPAGRPKGALNRSTLVRQLLDAKATDGGDGSVADQLVRAMIKKATNGDVNAYRELMDSAYGKIKDEADVGITYNLMPELKLNGKPLIFDIGKPSPRKEF